MSAQAKPGGGGGPAKPGPSSARSGADSGTGGTGGPAKRKPPAAASPSRNHVTEKLDKANENTPEADRRGPEPDARVRDTKDGPKVTTTNDRPGEPLVRIRPTGDSPGNGLTGGGASSALGFDSGRDASPDLNRPSGSKRPASSVRAPRKAHLVLRRIEPWSAMKFSFVVSLVCFVILFVAVAVLYGVLSTLGVFDSVVQTINTLTNPDGEVANAIDASSWFDPVRILGFTALIGAINVVLITALSTLGAVIYNVTSDIVGGVEVTFSEAE
ncbi:hypothetical protein Misp01_76350 [Microtetraspora sp. NBRC 13810]|nr:hypothetical protein Misp01_76350 [Microtetraspora sp. NBRC 13810]